MSQAKIELNQAKGEVKRAENDLATMEKAAQRAGSKVTMKEFQRALREECELGKAYTEAPSENTPSTALVFAMAFTQTPAQPPSRMPSGRQAESTWQEPVHTVRVQTPKGMSMEEMMDIMKTPGRAPLVKWMEDAMRFIEHGEGDTVADRILANAMQEKLKKAGRADDAAQIAGMLDVASPNWEYVMNLLDLCNPQEITNEKVINEFANSYSWKKKPMLEIIRALCEMDIQLGDTVMSDPDGVRLFRKLRSRLPEALRMWMLGRERYTWGEIAEQLQRFWNSQTLDEQIVRMIGGK